MNENEHTSDGVWLTLAKKDTSTPTTLTYTQALEEALCSGWIDGRKNKIDARTYSQHFTPRRARSMWSERNIEIVGALTAAGRMRERGHAEVALAQTDGRWDRAYAGPASIEVHDDLRCALRTAPDAEAAFNALTSGARYRILLDVTTARTRGLRANRIARHLAKLATPAQVT
ncbi:YdeI/OmpD-associated family protein [Arthrobacter sp. NPDC080082]|uniref:YdeI/OmpD-associated family protein n=1 Tax=unclassified Arthrobacter TaxID=235627 RepID=UPI00342F8B9F